MSILLALVMALYVVFVIYVSYHWRKIPYYLPDASLLPAMKVSVLIPVRNEANQIVNLLKDLNNQSYPSGLFEVIVIDDHSEDDTLQLIKQQSFNYSLKAISLKDYGIGTGKKLAIETGIATASGEIIITTDGDCRVMPDWLSITENFFQTTQCKMVTGAVTFHDHSNFFQKLQIIEFASLTGSGAASLEAGCPNMCNGANLAYKKQLFNEVEGYKGFGHIASGDDEFLMHKAFVKYPNGVKFLKNSGTVVSTDAKTTVSAFMQQRKRWAGKWNYYIFNYIKALAGFIFMVNLLLLLSFCGWLLGTLSFYCFFFCWLIKTCIDGYFIKNVLQLYKKKFVPLVFLTASLLYPIYVCLIAVSGNMGSYTWKGRKLHNQ